jgi:chorismate mutase / prephenate dehydratase
VSLSRKESVDALRKKIDQIDEKLVALLNDRASLAIRIGHNKRLHNEGIYAPDREQAILHRVAQLSRGPLPHQAIRSVFREVIGVCRSLESPLKVAFFGAEGTYSHLAAREKFGSMASLLPTSSIQEVFDEVKQGRVSFGVVPIENSTEGVVAHTLDLLVDSDLRICAETFLEVHHSLLSRTGRREDLERIISHPQALGQCRRWLAAHFPKVEVEEVASTAHAAMMAATDAKLGAISSNLAQEVYGLLMVAENIEDQSNNITRFLIIGGDDSRPSGDDKTSLVFSVQDRPGILHRMLEPFAKSRINLTKIESRPLKNKPWEYMFFIDFKGHKEENGVRRAIRKLEKSCLFLKVLGSYPSGI